MGNNVSALLSRNAVISLASLGVISTGGLVLYPSSLTGVQTLWNWALRVLYFCGRVGGWMLGLHTISTAPPLARPPWLRQIMRGPFLTVVWRLIVTCLSFIRQTIAADSVARQILAIGVIQGMLLLKQSLLHYGKAVVPAVWRRRSERRRQAEAQLRDASTYNEWRKVARHVDRLTGGHHWRKVDESEHFDAVRLKEKIKQYRVSYSVSMELAVW